MEKFIKKLKKIVKSKEFYKNLEKEIDLCLSNNYTYEDKNNIIYEISSNLYNNYFKNFENDYNKLVKTQNNRVFPDNLIDFVSILLTEPLEKMLYNRYRYSFGIGITDDNSITCQVCLQKVKKCFTIKYSINDDEFNDKQGIDLCKECAFELKNTIDKVFKDNNNTIK